MNEIKSYKMNFFGFKKRKIDSKDISLLYFEVPTVKEEYFDIDC